MAGSGLHHCIAPGIPTPPLRTCTWGLQSLSSIPLETIQCGGRFANPVRASISVGLNSHLIPEARSPSGESASRIAPGRCAMAEVKGSPHP